MTDDETDKPKIGRRKKGEKIPAVLRARYSKHFRYPLSELPGSMRTITRQVNALRIVLEEAAIARHGDISPTRAGWIQTALRFEQLTKVVERLLRDDGDKLDALEKAQLLDRIAKFSEKRDSTIGKLDLDGEAIKPGKLNFNAIDTKASTSPTPTTEAGADV